MNQNDNEYMIQNIVVVYSFSSSKTFNLKVNCEWESLVGVLIYT